VSRKKPKTQQGILGKAKEAADVGDRWFVSLASGIGKAFQKVRDEATIVADSAQKAAETTHSVGKDLKAKLTKARSRPKLHRAALLEELGAIVVENADNLDALRTRADVQALLAALRTEPTKVAPPRPSAPSSSSSEPRTNSSRPAESTMKAAPYRQN